eukprot:scaffold8.g1503.t1
MTAAAAARGVRLTSRSRPLRPSDFARFDAIIGMDASNLAAIRRAAAHWAGEGGAALPVGWEAKLGLMTEHLTDPKWKRYNEVPDPYWSGRDGFELVLDLLDDACQGLLTSLENGGAKPRG